MSGIGISTKVLWLSRHELSGTQVSDLARESGYEVLSVDTDNVTYPARSADAVDDLVARSTGYDLVCGVFPAHIAAEIVRRDIRGGLPASFWVPVSTPAPASDGALRGFQHSHWERLDKGWV